jgi:CDP-glycerol glycerophosphotransferase (TagB/SpsB family)
VGHYNPDYQRVAENPGLPKSNRLRILLLCEGVNYRAANNRITEIVYETLNAADFEYSLTLRLHPSDNNPERFKKLLSLDNVKVSTQFTEDVLALLQGCDVVLGYMSTALFEAVLLNKPVVYYRDEVSELHVPFDLGASYSGKENLSEILNKITTRSLIGINRSGWFWQSGYVYDNIEQSMNYKN